MTPKDIVDSIDITLYPNIMSIAMFYNSKNVEHYDIQITSAIGNSLWYKDVPLPDIDATIQKMNEEIK